MDSSKSHTSHFRSSSGAVTRRTRVKVCIDERGGLIGEPVVVLSSGHPRLDEASINLAKAGSGRYKPATRAGKPITDCTEFNVNWKLK